MTDEEDKKWRFPFPLSILHELPKELILWIVIGSVFLVKPYLSIFKLTPKEFFNAYSSSLICAILIIIVPIVTKFIFDAYPLRALRDLIIENNDIKLKRLRYDFMLAKEEKRYDARKKQNPDDLAISGYIYRKTCIDDSRKISEKLYRRSGVYLFIGCMIAFSGVLIFYFYNNTNDLEIVKSDNLGKGLTHLTLKDLENKELISFLIYQKIFAYLPRLGSLFFIEYVAFFFLKQYRTILEEFRYYEKIKRYREDEFNYILLLQQLKEDETLISLFTPLFKPLQDIALKKDETTQILEVEKLTNQQTDFLGKIADIIKASKGK